MLDRDWNVKDHQEETRAKKEPSRVTVFRPRNCRDCAGPLDNPYDKHCGRCSDRLFKDHMKMVEDHRAIGRGPRPSWIRFEDKKLYADVRTIWMNEAAIRTHHNGDRARARNRCRTCGKRALKHEIMNVCYRCLVIHRLSRILSGVKYNENTLEHTMTKSSAEIWGMAPVYQAMMKMEPADLESLRFFSLVGEDGSCPRLNLPGR